MVVESAHSVPAMAPPLADAESSDVPTALSTLFHRASPLMPRMDRHRDVDVFLRQPEDAPPVVYATNFKKIPSALKRHPLNSIGTRTSSGLLRSPSEPDYGLWETVTCHAFEVADTAAVLEIFTSNLMPNICRLTRRDAAIQSPDRAAAAPLTELLTTHHAPAFEWAPSAAASENHSGISLLSRPGLSECDTSNSVSLDISGIRVISTENTCVNPLTSPITSEIVPGMDASPLQNSSLLSEGIESSVPWCTPKEVERVRQSLVARHSTYQVPTLVEAWENFSKLAKGIVRRQIVNYVDQLCFMFRITRKAFHMTVALLDRIVVAVSQAEKPPEFLQMLKICNHSYGEWIRWAIVCSAYISSKQLDLSLPSAQSALRLVFDITSADAQQRYVTLLPVMETSIAQLLRWRMMPPTLQEAVDFQLAAVGLHSVCFDCTTNYPRAVSSTATDGECKVIGLAQCIADLLIRDHILAMPLNLLATETVRYAVDLCLKRGHCTIREAHSWTRSLDAPVPYLHDAVEALLTKPTSFPVRKFDTKRSFLVFHTTPTFDWNDGEGNTTPCANRFSVDDDVFGETLRLSRQAETPPPQ